MIIIPGTSNLKLAKSISENLHCPLAPIDIVRFADQEIYAEINQTIRGKDTFIIQSTSTPANDYLIELLIIIDALKRGSARRINCVIPYFGYARQDRKTASRSPISAKLVANLITTAGANRIISLDLHSLQIQGFFDIPVDHMSANILFVNHIMKSQPDLSNTVIVSPDIGGVKRARIIAKHLNCDLAIIDKRRGAPGSSEVMNIIGTVANKSCILIDDLADSCGTICNASQALKSTGKAKKVMAYCTHGVFSSQAFDRVNNSSIDKLICTDSILQSSNIHELSAKVEIVTCSELLANAIKCINTEQSTHNLFLKKDGMD